MFKFLFGFFKKFFMKKEKKYVAIFKNIFNSAGELETQVVLKEYKLIKEVEKPINRKVENKVNAKIYGLTKGNIQTIKADIYNKYHGGDW